MVIVVESIPRSHPTLPFACLKIGFHFKFCFRNGDYSWLPGFFDFMSRTLFWMIWVSKFQQGQEISFPEDTD
jgi:hypothetical protein